MSPEPARSTRSLARSAARGPSRSSKTEAPAAVLHVGTSGWHYQSWLGPFYPEATKAKDFLAYYVTRFRTTELNNPFYRTPTEAVVRSWRDGTPEGFLFAWKVSRVITHLKRLKEVEENVSFVVKRAEGLGPKLGPLLVQLPPSLRADRDRLAGFLALLPKERRFTFEFRHPSWFEPPILDLLRDHDASLCLSDHAAAPAPWQATASFVYIRGHGPEGRYAGSYSDEALAEWSAHIAHWRAEGRDVYAYFDNDIKSAAPGDADRLIALTAPR
jgi:uncharacterized protein YecE (DUF72 family)